MAVYKSKFGNLTVPFGRHKEPRPPHKQKVESYHKNRKNFKEFIHNGKHDGEPEYPKPLKTINASLLKKIENRNCENKKDYCYLWVINKREIIEILWEGQYNPQDVRDNLVKHTNITAGKEAYHGGEMYFGTNNTIYINNASDRYGPADGYWQVVVDHFKAIYNKYKIVDINTK